MTAGQPRPPACVPAAARRPSPSHGKANTTPRCPAVHLCPESSRDAAAQGTCAPLLALLATAEKASGYLARGSRGSSTRPLLSVPRRRSPP